MMLLPPSFPITYRPDLQKALTGFLRFIAQSVSIAILSFSANLTVFYDCSCDGNRKQKHKITWYPPPHLLCHVLLTPQLLAGWLVLILACNQFILITMGSAGSTGSDALIDWQVFAYTVRNKMSRPALVMTCVGCWQNKLMKVIYHAACALLSRGSRAHYC